MSDKVRRAVDRLWGDGVAGTHAGRSAIHGFSHWVRVERNGLYIASRTGASQAVVSLFALFHDSRRENDGMGDKEHGLRAAELVLSMRPELSFLSSEDFERLRFACEHHTHQVHHDDPTVGTCWDADRLELARVGIEPDPRYFNTAPAIELVRSDSLRKIRSLRLRRGE